jgi:RNA recognition motif-containing protein
MANKTLYVGNIPYNATDGDITVAFSAYGATNVRIIEGRGFAFVDIEAEKLDTAINDKHGTQMGGRTLTVNEARPKSERSDFGGGGGGNRGGYRSGGGGGGGGRGNRW